MFEIKQPNFSLLLTEVERQVEYFPSIKAALRLQVYPHEQEFIYTGQFWFEQEAITAFKLAIQSIQQNSEGKAVLYDFSSEVHLTLEKCKPSEPLHFLIKVSTNTASNLGISFDFKSSVETDIVNVVLNALNSFIWSQHD